MRIAITGHRKWPSPSVEKARFFKALDTFLFHLEKFEIKRKCVIFIHGCALGIDTWFGTYAVDNNMELELYLPFNRRMQIMKGKFKAYDIKELHRQIEHARKVVVVNKRFSYWGYQKRNMALVDNSDLLCTYFARSRSGSGNALRYAIEVERWTLDLRKFADKQDLPFTIHDLNAFME